MSNEESIAIVGVSALFPGSLDAQGFWHDILSGTDLIEEVPASHWLLDDYYAPDVEAEDKTYARKGAFLEEVDFDPMDYGVPPNVLAATDTGQLLAMIVARQLLEDAYDAPFEEVDSSRIGVVLGVASTTELCLHMAGRLQQPIWEEGMRRSGLSEDEVGEISDKITEMYVPWQESTFPGLLGNVVSGRIANRFDLGGTNCVVDAACASSLAALEMGVNQLNLGQADMMIAGGVDALNDILMYMCFSQTGALSKSGDCRPFSSSADGTMMAEGLGMFALKRLEDAEADDDDIYAVIRGIGSSSDGRAKSIYAPRPEGQSLALRRAYDDAGYEPETVEMIEAHGTATPAGDAAEMRGLKSVFGENQDDQGRTQWCALGSVKSQIGHAKAAAGAAGLFKTVMSLNDRVLPPTIKVDEPNPDLELDESPFYVNTEPRPWIRPSDHPRRNAVSAFGFGGTNFHVTLEEYDGDADQAPRRRTLDSELVVVSADDPTRLADRCTELAGEADTDGMLQYLARSTQRDFDVDQPARLAVVASDEQDLIEKLEQAANAISSNPEKAFEAPNGIYYGFDEKPGEVAFLFPGQGSQYLNMGGGWAMHFDAAREVWDRAADLQLDDELRLDEVVYPPPVFSEEARDRQRDRLTATQWAQPALGATSISALELLEGLGVEPACAGGHSYGEVTALRAAGVLDDETMLEVSRKRGELMADASDVSGSMTAVRAGADQLEEWLDDWELDLVIANHNTPSQCVLSGATSEIEEVEQKLDEVGASYTRLPVATAFHSSLVSDSADPFEEFLETVDFGEADFPVYANTTAGTYPGEPDEMVELLGRQLANPVRFVDQIEAMYDDGARTFVEVGPKSTLSGMVGQILGDRSHHRIHLDQAETSGIESLFEAVGQLAVSGLELNFEALWEDYEEIDDPREEDDAGFSVSINGTNYNKPYPGDDPRPEPDERPSLPEDVVASIAESIEPRDSTSNTSRGTSTMSSQEETTETRAQSETGSRSRGPDAGQRRTNGRDGAVQPAGRTEAGPPARSANGSAPAEDGGASGPAWQQTAETAGDASWVDAFREQQRQTAEAHRTFQETTAEAHQRFLETMDSSFRALGQIATGESVDRPRPAQLEGPPSRSADPERSGRTPTTGRATNGRAERSRDRGGSRTDGRDAARTDTGRQTGSRPAERTERRSGGRPGAGRAEGSPAGSGRQPGTESSQSVRTRSQAPVDGRTNGGSATGRARPVVSDDSTTATEEPGGRTETSEAPETTDTRDQQTLDPEGGADDVDVLDLLTSTVADKTGYPTEMLEPQMELEADLGVDSIKQVEIMSEMEEQVPQLPEVEANELADLDSLEGIAEYLQGLLGDQGGAGVPAGGESTSADPGGDADVPDLGEVLTEVVAEKTGYPAEMLEPEMELEADLGVDSIKQVEIMSEMEERFPQLPEVEANELADLESLDEISTYLEGLMGGREPRSNSSSRQDQDKGSDDDSEDDYASDAIARYVVRRVDAPACGWAMPGIFEVETVDVVSADLGVAESLVEQLDDRGVDARIVDEADADSRAVVHLGGLRSVEDLEEATAVNRDVILTARDLVEDGDPPELFVTVHNTGGRFESADGSIERAWLAGIGGLTKTAAAEWPESSLKSIDLGADGLDVDRQAELLADELVAGGPELEVGIDAEGRRTTPVAVDEPVESTGADAELEDGDVLVVSGGAKGVTASSIVKLAERRSLKFVLMGRSELTDEPEVCQGVEGDAELKEVLLEEAKQEGEMPSPRELQSKVKEVQSSREIRTTLSKLEQLGAEARYESADVRDRRAVAEALEEVREDWGPIDGLIHGAGVLADSLIEDKTAGDFDFVFGTKIEGLESLMEATADDPLKVIGLFSSVAARSGNPGQSDYAMANEVLNKVARAEADRREDCRVKALGWGPWDGGMVTDELKALFEEEGVVLLPEDWGVEMFADELLEAPADDVELVLGGSASAEGINGSKLGGGVAADFVVDAESHPYLDSHRLKGTPVVPAMLVVEWFTRFARACRPNLVVESIRDMDVRKGVELDNFEEGGDRLTIRARLADESEQDDRPIIELDLKGADGTLHYSAVCRMAPEHTGIDEVDRSRYDFEVPESPFDLDEIYREGRLFHGPDFEVLTDIEGIGQEGGIAELDGLLRMDWPDEDWKTDPAAMDGALQIGLLWGLDLIGHQTLPMQVEKFIPFVGAPSDQPLVCRVRRADHGSRKIVADVLIETRGGEAVCELRGVSMYAVPDGV